jgi:hypothetical protein
MLDTVSAVACCWCYVCIHVHTAGIINARFDRGVHSAVVINSPMLSPPSTDFVVWTAWCVVLLFAAAAATFAYTAHAGIINAQLLSWMRPRSALINGGRGGHVVEADLLAALDSQQVCVCI